MWKKSAEERVHPVPARQPLLRQALVVGRDGPLQDRDREERGYKKNAILDPQHHPDARQREDAHASPRSPPLRRSAVRRCRTSGTPRPREESAIKKWAATCPQAGCERSPRRIRRVTLTSLAASSTESTAALDRTGRIRKSLALRSPARIRIFAMPTINQLVRKGREKVAHEDRVSRPSSSARRSAASAPASTPRRRRSRTRRFARSRAFA